jgi:hypothetical protein
MALLIMMSITPMRWLRKSRIVYWGCFAIAFGVFVLLVVSMICMVWTSGPEPDMTALVIAPIVLVVFLVGPGSLPAAFLLSHIANGSSPEKLKPGG